MAAPIANCVLPYIGESVAPFLDPRIQVIVAASLAAIALGIGALYKESSPIPQPIAEGPPKPKGILPFCQNDLIAFLESPFSFRPGNWHPDPEAALAIIAGAGPHLNEAMDGSWSFAAGRKQVAHMHKLHREKYKTLLGILDRFDGFCELICNRVLVDDLLGKEEVSSLYDHINIRRLNETKIKKCHILDIYSIFRKMLAYLFGIYPDNIFSCFDQWKLVDNKSPELLVAGKIIPRDRRMVNREILGQGLKNIAVGVTLKLEVFGRSGLSLKGHSLLIKKMANDKYIFFDPNTGEHRDLSFDHLSDRIDEQLQQWNGADVFLMKGDDFLKRMES